jgi:3',5'-cyclic-AMP phosphodiesterase
MLSDHDGVRVIDGLDPDTPYTIDEVTVRTLPSPGTVRSRFVTMNDVHFGEFECGKFQGQPAQFVADPKDPYPLVMNRAVVAEALALQPDLCVVKGDLTNEGLADEEALFRSTYAPFGGRLLYVRGNHDSYQGRVFADWPIQIRDLPGVRIVLLDTARVGRSGGCLAEEQIAATVAAVRDATTPTIVMGHHPLEVGDVTGPNEGVCAPDAERFLAALAGEAGVVGYFAGHTHRNLIRVVRGVPLVEVAAVKDFPGAWASYEVGDRGITHVVHRARAPQAFAWAEQTKSMFGGFYESYALGTLEDRSRWFPLERPLVAE